MLLRGDKVLGKIQSPATYSELAAFVAERVGVRLAKDRANVSVVKAGQTAVATAAARTLAVLAEAMHNADVGRVIELELILRELAWYGRPEMAEGLPLQGPDYLLMAATTFGGTTSLFLMVWYFWVSPHLEEQAPLEANRGT